MCLIQTPNTPTVQAPAAPPALQSAQVQSGTEQDRLLNNLRGLGVQATQLTSGLGDTSAAPTSRVTLG